MCTKRKRPLAQASEHRRVKWEGGVERMGPLLAFEKRKNKMKPYHNMTIGGWR